MYNNFWGKWKNYQRDITWKLKKDQLFLHATHCRYLIHIPIKFNADSPNGYRVIRCTRMTITQNKHRTIKEP